MHEQVTDEWPRARIPFSKRSPWAIDLLNFVAKPSLADPGLSDWSDGRACPFTLERLVL